eukprot:TRINITY_DN111938_c0_g1_i1.p1 TRINITY_DN111938_c0_g1~~TRINITY_DN111938_c0_g1_i1.p1  ORF type:complete len:261 (+),score=121.32 TRINITY_DN111938_c0_g1_i1:93-875(+)
MAEVDPLFAAEELGSHLDDLTKKHREMSVIVADLEGQKKSLEEEYEEAGRRLELIQGTNVEEEMIECKDIMESETSRQAELMEQIQAFDKELGNYKQELQFVFDNMHKKSNEMKTHCKAKADDTKHTDDLEAGIEYLQAELDKAKAHCAKKQERHAAQLEWDECQQRKQEAMDQLKAYEKQKKDEEDEAGKIEARFVEIRGQLEDLQKVLDEKKAILKEYNDLLIETQEAHARIMKASESLLSVLQKDSVILNRQAKKKY